MQQRWSRAFVMAVAACGVLAWSQPWSASAQPQTAPPPPPQQAPGEPKGQPPLRGPNQPGERGPEGRRPDGPGGPGGQRGVSIEGAMKGMNRGLKVLKAQVADPAKKEESLRAINEMQRSCVAAKGQPLPKNILEKSGDGKNLLEKTGHEKSQAQLTAAYRKHMIAALRLMLDIEEAITADNTTVAQTKLAELEKLRDSSHDELGVKDE